MQEPARTFKLARPGTAKPMPRLFVENLSVIDCAYLDAQRGLVGESWLVDIELQGALDAQSMVLDFGEAKRLLKQGIDGSVDHRLLIPARAAGLSLHEQNRELRLCFQAAPGRYEHRSPRSAVCLLDAETVNPAAVIAFLQPQLQALLPAGVRLHLQLRNEPIDGAYYHYVHGLKRHAGLCRHIAHGHRSRIEIRVDGRRDAKLEQEIASRWRDIYLGCREDRIEGAPGEVRFAYQASDGRYELVLPAARVDFLDCDSTIEQIADHLAARLAPRRPGHELEVRAYEGHAKGAIGNAVTR